MQFDGDKLIDKYIEEYERLEARLDDPKERAETLIKLSKKTLAQLKMDYYDLDKVQARTEIKVFKDWKPAICARLYYQMLRLKCELEAPLGKKSKYYKTKLKETNAFLSRHQDFLNYINLGHTCYDKEYFTRKEEIALAFEILDENWIMTDEFSTTHSELLGRLDGHRLFAEYLDRKINENKPVSKNSKSGFKWIESKVDLIEMIYAISDSIHYNGKKVEQKELVKFFESSFGVKIPNHYALFGEIRKRRDTTKYLDKAKQNIENKVKDLDK